MTYRGRRVPNGLDARGRATRTAFSIPSFGAQNTGPTSIAAPEEPLTLLLSEPVDDANFSSRGWYDDTNIPIVADAPPGYDNSLQAAFPSSATTPTGFNSMRHLFTPSERVYLRYWAKYSTNWVGSAHTYHPHEFLIHSDLDNDFAGTGSYLTAFIEHNYQSGGKPYLALGDPLNIDLTHGTPPNNLIAVTEIRSVGGCNGIKEPGGVSEFSCYDAGGGDWYNAKTFLGPSVVFQPNPGTGYKNNWNRVEVLFQMNTVSGGIGLANGIIRYWFNGTLVYERTDVLFRTGQRPTLKFKQLRINPFIGDGSPVAQTAQYGGIEVWNNVSPYQSPAVFNNEPAGYTIIGEHPGNVIAFDGFSTDSGPPDLSIVTDSGSPKTPPNVIQEFYPQNFSSTGFAPGHIYYFGLGGIRTFFIGFFFKFSLNFDDHLSGIQKLMFCVNNDFSNDIIIKFVGSYPNYSLYGYKNGDLAPNVNNPNVTAGVWHKVELAVNMNAGTYKWWMDDIAVGNYSGVSFAAAGQSEWQLSPTWGGNGGPNKAHDDYIWFDDIRISAP